MINKLEEKEYQVNKFFIGVLTVDNIEYPYTLEIINFYGSEEDQDYNINWQHFPPNIEECERLILEMYKERQTI
jgi:hypothetical protein